MASRNLMLSEAMPRSLVQRLWFWWCKTGGRRETEVTEELWGRVSLEPTHEFLPPCFHRASGLALVPVASSSMARDTEERLPSSTRASSL